MAKKTDARPTNLDELIINELDNAYNKAESFFQNRKEGELPPIIKESLNEDFIEALEGIAKLCEKASSGYLNVITGLSFSNNDFSLVT